MGEHVFLTPRTPLQEFMLTLASLPRPQETCSGGGRTTCNWLTGKLREKKEGIRRSACGMLSFGICFLEQGLTFWSVRFHAVRDPPLKMSSSTRPGR